MKVQLWILCRNFGNIYSKLTRQRSLCQLKFQNWKPHAWAELSSVTRRKFRTLKTKLMSTRKKLISTWLRIWKSVEICRIKWSNWKNEWKFYFKIFEVETTISIFYTNYALLWHFYMNTNNKDTFCGNIDKKTRRLFIMIVNFSFL